MHGLTGLTIPQGRKGWLYRTGLFWTPSHVYPYPPSGLDPYPPRPLLIPSAASHTTMARTLPMLHRSASHSLSFLVLHESPSFSSLSFLDRLLQKRASYCSSCKNAQSDHCSIQLYSHRASNACDLNRAMMREKGIGKGSTAGQSYS